MLGSVEIEFDSRMLGSVEIEFDSIGTRTDDGL
jgi:hypothetical protein